jgi:DUF1680 family protein
MRRRWGCRRGPVAAVAGRPVFLGGIRGEFWTGRQQVNREKTIPHLMDMCEREGRVRNLWRAAGRLEGGFEGTRTHDADLFKVIEAASCTLVSDFDPQLDGTTFYYYNRLAARPDDATGLPYSGIVTETDKARLPRNCLRRQPWFKVPCCPPNVAMAIATVGRYAYATSPDAVYVNQYLDSVATVSPGMAPLRVTQKTRYPWDTSSSRGSRSRPPIGVSRRWIGGLPA